MHSIGMSLKKLNLSIVVQPTPGLGIVVPSPIQAAPVFGDFNPSGVVGDFRVIDVRFFNKYIY